MERTYGWRPDKPDFRDHKFSASIILSSMALPATIDLSINSSMPLPYDQGTLGCCTGEAIKSAMAFLNNLVFKKEFVPSELFIYYNERVMEGTIKEDAGAEIRDGIKSVAKLGACSLDKHKFIISKFTKKPTRAAYAEALKHLAISYKRVDNTSIQDIKASIASSKPVVFGFSVYESFESDAVAKTGIMPIPTNTERCLGGHAVLAVGYDDSKQMIKVRNSWGSNWGDKGYFYMPYQFITNPNFCDDFWSIDGVTGLGLKK